jgi:hypothetical protein
MENNIIYIDQTLHGYSDGHRLLASSFSVDSALDRQLLVMSDLSGSNVISGFEEYYTFYPLPKHKKYVIAKTWYASEMRRPGCVWTQSLIISPEDLSYIKDVRLIISHFHRPHTNIPFSSYQIIIQHETFTCYSKNISTNKQYINYQSYFPIFELIYKRPEFPIIIVTNEKSDLENFLFLIWNQQWPNLRSEFSFSTGSLSLRKLPEGQFDIQIVPSNNNNFFNISLITNNIIVQALNEGGDYSQTNNIDSENKITFVNNKLKNIDNQIFYDRLYLLPFDELFFSDFDNKGFTNFAWEYGLDIPNARKNFQHLVKIFEIFKKATLEENYIYEILDLIANYYPNTKDAKKLKFDIFTTNSQLYQDFQINELPESAMLYILFTTKYYKIFSPAELNIKNRTAYLYKQSPTTAIDLLVKISEIKTNLLGNIYVRKLAKIIDPNDFLDLLQINPQITRLLIENNVCLAFIPEIWQQSYDYQLHVLEILKIKIISAKVISKISISIYLNSNDQILTNFLNHFGFGAINSIINFLDSEETLDESTSVEMFKRFQIFQNYSEHMINIINNNDKLHFKTQISIFLLLTNNLELVAKINSKILLSLSEQTAKDNSTSKYETSLYILSKFLQIGLWGDIEDSEILVENSFEIFHAALQKKDFPYSVWFNIQSILPNLPWWQEWDKCERLRRGFVQAFDRNNWSFEVFLKTLNNPNTLFKVIEYCVSTTKYKRIIILLEQQINNGKINCSEKQKYIINLFNI